MNQASLYDHDCARCGHSPAFGLEYVDDPQLGMQELQTSVGSQIFLFWQPSTSPQTQDSVSIEQLPNILYYMGQRINTLRYKLESKDRERLDLELDLANSRDELQRLRQIWQAQSQDRSGASGIRLRDGEQAIVAEVERLITRVGYIEKKLQKCKDWEIVILEELHGQRLARGCTCCNEAIHRVNDILSQE